MPGLLANEDVLDSSEYKALDKFVSGKKKDLDSAVNDFCDPVETQANSGEDAEEIEASLWRAWQSVTAVAAKTAHDSEGRQKLAHLVTSIQKRPKVQSGGEALKVWDSVVWRDLPVFGAQMREAWNFAATDSSSKEEQSAWLNLNAFTATLASSIRDSELSLFGLWSLRTALEEQAEKPDIVAVSAADLWLTYAGDFLQDLSRQDKTFDGKIAKPGSRFSDKGWRGFTEERWQIWNQRVGEAEGSA